MNSNENEILREEILKFLKWEGDKLQNLLDTLAEQNLLDTLAEQMVETQGDGTDVLCVGSDGKSIIKVLHFPRSVLNEDGPVILPSADDKVVLAAFSDEFVQENLDEVRNIFPDPSAREQQWEQFLNSLTAKVRRKHALLAEFDWDVFDLDSRKQLMTEELFYPERLRRTRDMSVEDQEWYAETGFPTPEQVFDRYRPILDAKYPDWEENVKKGIPCRRPNSRRSVTAWLREVSKSLFLNDKTG